MLLILKPKRSSKLKLKHWRRKKRRRPRRWQIRQQPSVRSKKHMLRNRRTED
jgi:hypothetical protein